MAGIEDSSLGKSSLWAPKKISKLATSSLVPKLPFNPDDKSCSELRTYFSSKKIVKTASEDSKDEDGDCCTTTSERTDNLREIHRILLTQMKETAEEDEGRFRRQNNLGSSSSSSSWIADLILLLGEQHDGSKPWSCPENDALVSDIIRILKLLILDDNKNINANKDELLEELFLQDFAETVAASKTVFGRSVKALRSKLRQDCWRQFPAAVHAFQWISYQVKVKI
jgi:hypothetical protein